MGWENWLYKAVYQFSRNIGANTQRKRLESTYGKEAADAALATIKRGGNNEQVDAAIRATLEAQAVQQHQTEMLNNPPAIHGSARWATPDECRQRNLLHQANIVQRGPGLWFGLLNDDSFYAGDTSEYRPGSDAWLYWNKPEGHILTVAPTRTGKGATQIIPNLLLHEGSAVVIDPKGENARLTLLTRSELLGQDIFIIDPFGEHTDCFNPLDSIQDYDGARTMAEMLLPRAATGTQNEFFENTSINLLSALIYYVCAFHPPDQRTLSAVRVMIGASPEEKATMIARMATCGSAEITHSINLFLALKPERQASTLEDIDAQTKLWDSPRLQHVISRSHFSFAELKTRPITVYITVPVDRLEAYAAFTRTLIGTAIDQLTRHPALPNPPVLFVMDEFPIAIGDLKKVVEGFGHLAGMGIRLWLIAQNLHQLREKCPKSYGSILSEAAVKSFFGTRDFDTLEMLSRSLGQRTVSYLSTSSNMNYGLSSSPESGSGSTGSGTGTSVQFSARALVTPDELGEFMSEERAGTRSGIMWIEGLPRPIRTVHSPYYLGNGFQEVMDLAVEVYEDRQRQQSATPAESTLTQEHKQHPTLNGWQRDLPAGTRVINSKDLQRFLYPNGDLEAFTPEFTLEYRPDDNFLEMHWYTFAGQPSIYWHDTSTSPTMGLVAIQIQNVRKTDSVPLFELFLDSLASEQINPGILNTQQIRQDIERFLATPEPQVPKCMEVQLNEALEYSFEGTTYALIPGRYDTKRKRWRSDDGYVTTIEIVGGALQADGKYRSCEGTLEQSQLEAFIQQGMISVLHITQHN